MVTATGIVLLFILAGEFMLKVFHVTIPALKIAGGIILLLVALHMVMGEMGNEEKQEVEAPAPSLDMAIFPLAVPMLATPQGIVAIVAERRRDDVASDYDRVLQPRDHGVQSSCLARGRADRESARSLGDPGDRQGRGHSCWRARRSMMCWLCRIWVFSSARATE